MTEREKVFVVGEEHLRPNEIPSILTFGSNLPEAWENAVLATWEHGAKIPTEYDQPIDPDSRDASVVIVVASPQEEPRIHLGGLPTGFDELWIYTQEVVEGVHNRWVRNGGWSYSYHDRLTAWPGRQRPEDIIHLAPNLLGKELDFLEVDQISQLMIKLSESPHSRRAQAITWFPSLDAEHHEPPCLQRIWCRIVEAEKGLYLLEMNTHWRSRDALKAAFMNMFALTELQKKMAGAISALSGRQIIPGRYVDISDSFHIYGSYIRKKGDGSKEDLSDMEKFIHLIEKRSFERRTIGTIDPVVQAEFAEAVRELARNDQ